MWSQNQWKKCTAPRYRSVWFNYILTWPSSGGSDANKNVWCQKMWLPSPAFKAEWWHRGKGMASILPTTLIISNQRPSNRLPTHTLAKSTSRAHTSVVPSRSPALPDPLAETALGEGWILLWLIIDVCVRHGTGVLCLMACVPVMPRSPSNWEGSLRKLSPWRCPPHSLVTPLHGWAGLAQ